MLSELIPVNDFNLINEGEKLFVKNVGEKIDVGTDTYKQVFVNSWKYNTSSRFQVEGQGPYILKTPIDKSSLKVGDQFEILKRNEQVIIDHLTLKVSMKH